MNTEYIRIGGKSIEKEALLNMAYKMYFSTKKPISISCLVECFGVAKYQLGGKSIRPIRDLLISNDLPIRMKSTTNSVKSTTKKSSDKCKIIWSRSSDDAKLTKPQTDPSFTAILATCNEAAKHDVILARRIMETFLSLPQTA
jgi:hypothetical protein